MSKHPKGKMILPTTNPNRLDVEWYAQECAWMQVELGKLKTENAALRELATRMAAEMREVDHDFASLQDYDAARKKAQL